MEDGRLCDMVKVDVRIVSVDLVPELNDIQAPSRAVADASCTTPDCLEDAGGDLR